MLPPPKYEPFVEVIILWLLKLCISIILCFLYPNIIVGCIIILIWISSSIYVFTYQDVDYIGLYIKFPFINHPLRVILYGIKTMNQ
jgi:hypothetical protein